MYKMTIRFKGGEEEDFIMLGGEIPRFQSELPKSTRYAYIHGLTEDRIYNWDSVESFVIETVDEKAEE
jgi:hypothetical protein